VADEEVLAHFGRQSRKSGAKNPHVSAGTRDRKLDAKKPPRATRASARCCNKLEKLGFTYKQISVRIGLCIEHWLRRAWNACRELENPPQPGFEASNPFP
jgi:hypothetical protein